MSWKEVGRKNAEETVEGKGFKIIQSRLAEALAAGDKDSCFELLALDEEDV